MNRHMGGVLRCILLTALVSFALTCMPAQAVADCRGEDRQKVRIFLQDYTGPRKARASGARYLAALVDLRDDGEKELLVYLTGPWCGSGGCTALVVECISSASYVVRSRISLSRPPIRVLEAKTHGWHDLGVWLQGGGILPGYEAELPFDGKTYPPNPTLSPARRSTGEARGQIVIGANEARAGSLLDPE